jgi:hypothetical protein
MQAVEAKLHYLSQNQLKALWLLARSSTGIISSSKSAQEIGLFGKALGGVYSSLSRQRIAGERIVLPWGKSNGGRGLRWKLNENLVPQHDLATLLEPLLTAHEEE